jgi:uncharacterized protein involved in response to NO
VKTLSVLVAEAFRPFFLGGAAFVTILMALWVMRLAGWNASPSGWDPIWWHAHEMVYGFVPAAIAGFLLTAVPVWTQSPRVQGAKLVAIFGAWIAGRVAMTVPLGLSAAGIAIVDLAFLPALALCIARPIIARGKSPRLLFPLLVLVLFVGNALTHWPQIDPGAGTARLGLRVGIYVIALLIAIIGGRIVPAFTQNAFRRDGIERTVRQPPRLAPISVGITALFFIVDAAALSAELSALFGGAAALLLLFRWSGWQPLATRYDPLLWSLHLGYLWVPIGIALIATAKFTPIVPWSAGIHALTAGAMGTMILAVMTRVGLGHTGRQLQASKGAVIAYALVTVGAVGRVGAAWFPELGTRGLILSGILWAAAYAVFFATYARILLSPRVDAGTRDATGAARITRIANE